MNTKLPWYIIPLYPALSLLIGANLTQLMRHRYSWKHNAYKYFFSLLASILGLLFIYLCWWSQPQDQDLILIAFSLVLTITLTTILFHLRSVYFVHYLIGGLYLTLLIFFSSHHSIWELSEAEPVKPIAELIKGALLPKNQIIYSSYPYYRPSLDFYSDYRVIPLSEVDLHTILTAPNSAYFLIDKSQKSIAKTKVIAANDNWQISIKN